MNAVTVLLLVCVGVISAYPHQQNKIDPDLDQHWEAFKNTYVKSYDPQFEFVRRLIWESNLRYIQKHNLEFDMGQHTYFLGVNEHADLTNDEFRAKFTGLRQKSRNSSAESLFMSPLNVGDLPETVDWRPKGYVTPVKNQQQCGSCWAFSTTGSLEGQYFRKNGKLVSFSEQQLVDCSGSFGNQGCNGGLMDDAFDYIKEKGIEKESDYPYTARDGRCKYDASKVVTKVSGHTDVPQGDEDSLKQAAATVGPIAVAIDASHISFQLYRGGVYSERRCSSTQLDHGVLVVGYGTESGKHYWLVKNSWGATWGTKGYIMMSRNENNQCGIATSASYPIM